MRKPDRGRCSNQEKQVFEGNIQETSAAQAGLGPRPVSAESQGPGQDRGKYIGGVKEVRACERPGPAGDDR